MQRNFTMVFVTIAILIGMLASAAILAVHTGPDGPAIHYTPKGER